MRKITKILLFCFLIKNAIKAQTNLVPNGSFENYSQCPNTVNQVTYSVDWLTLSQTPDYFNACATNTDISIPINLFGQQYPASGNGYMGLFSYVASVPNAREIIGAQLTNSLSIGQKYYIKFKLNLTLDYVSNTATDKVGIRFSTVQHNSVTASPPINNFAHVYATAPITDSTNWTMIFKSFVADSNYKFIEVGNFFDDANTIKLIQWPQTTNRSYYYFDELCVSTDSLFTLNYTTSIPNQVKEKRFMIFPNPTSNNILFFSVNLENANVKFFDLTGMEVDSYKIEYSNQIRLNLPEGFYIIKVKSTTVNFIEKLIIKN